MKKLICILSFLLPLSVELFAQGNVYRATNTVLIELIGYDTTFKYTSDDFFSRLSKRNTQIEFSLPLNTVKPASYLKAMQLFASVFPPNQALLLKLTAAIPKSTFNPRELKEAKSYILDGVLSLFNESVRVPVRISMYYQEGGVFFNLNFNFDLDLWEMKVPQRIASVFTGKIKVYVRNGVWDKFLFD